MIVEKQMECRLAGETDVLGENLPQRHFCPLLSRFLLTETFCFSFIRFLYIGLFRHVFFIPSTFAVITVPHKSFITYTKVRLGLISSLHTYTVAVAVYFHTGTAETYRCPTLTNSHRGGPGSNPDLVMWDFVMDKSGAGARFPRELRFPLPIYIPSASPQSSSLSPEAGTIGQE
jgi:hypothetical protein